MDTTHRESDQTLPVLARVVGIPTRRPRTAPHVLPTIYRMAGSNKGKKRPWTDQAATGAGTFLVYFKGHLRQPWVSCCADGHLGPAALGWSHIPMAHMAAGLNTLRDSSHGFKGDGGDG